MVDPVCHRAVAPDPLLSLKHGGSTYFFCSTRCLSKFRVWPQCYTAAAPALGRRAGPPRFPGQPPERVFSCDVNTPGATQDPVCGMMVGPDSPHRLRSHGTLFRFCSARCLKLFEVQS